MCIWNKKCQRCETCGRLKYQFWMSAEMHDRGCPFGHDRMDQCAETVDHARMLVWARGQGAAMTPTGIALIEQMQAAGIALHPRLTPSCFRGSMREGGEGGTNTSAVLL